MSEGEGKGGEERQKEEKRDRLADFSIITYVSIM